MRDYRCLELNLTEVGAHNRAEIMKLSDVLFHGISPDGDAKADFLSAANDDIPPFVAT